MKKMLSVLLASATALSVCCGLAACGGDGKNTITVWAPDGAIEGYKELANEFTTTYQDGKYSEYKIKFVAKPEGEVETALGTDASVGADVFFFETGQVQNMISKNLLQPLSGDFASYTTAIKARDAQSTIDPIIKNDVCYAFPTTADNSWFLWYDSEFYTEDDIKTLDAMVAKAKASSKHIMFNYGDGWYITSFFQGAGCTMDFEFKDDGTKEYKTDVATSDAGKNAARAIYNYLTPANNGGVIIKPSSDMNSEIPAGMKEGSLVAGFIGTWAGKDMPAKAKPAKCPTFTCNGEQVQMGSFVGGKYCGVNPRRGNKEVAAALADFLTNEKGQQKRFDTTEAGPTNKNVAASDAVKNNAPLAALAAQSAAGGYAQLSQPNGFWNAMAAYGNDCASGDITEANLLTKLADLATAMAK